MPRCAPPRASPTAPWPGCWPSCPRSASTPTRRWSSSPAWRRSPTTAAQGPASGISAAAAPASVRSCSWSADIACRFDQSLAAFHRKLTRSRQAQNGRAHRARPKTPRPPQRKSTRSASISMPLQLDNPDSRSPRKRGEGAHRRCCRFFLNRIPRQARVNLTRSGTGSGLLALSRNSMVLKIISWSPRFSRSWTLYSPGP